MGSGGGILGKATDFVGLTNNKGEKQAQETANRMADSSMAAAQASIEMQREQLQFMKDQYKDWQDVYGDIQKNLGDYYTNMSKDSEIAKINTNLSFNLQTLATEYGAADKQIRRQMMQAGLEGSGVQAAANTQTTNQYASDRARARAQANLEITNAPDTVAQKQMGFLGLGLNQGQALLGNISAQSGQATQAYGLQASVASNFYNQNYSTQQQLAQSNQMFGLKPMFNSFMGAAGEGVAGGLTGSMFKGAGQGAAGGLTGSMFSDYRLKQNIRLIDNVDGFNIYEWSWNKEAEKLGFSGKAKGVIAQELLQNHSDKVNIDKTDYLVVDYSKLPITVQSQVKGY